MQGEHQHCHDRESGLSLLPIQWHRCPDAAPVQFLQVAFAVCPFPQAKISWHCFPIETSKLCSSF